MQRLPVCYLARFWRSLSAKRLERIDRLELLIGSPAVVALALLATTTTPTAVAAEAANEQLAIEEVVVTARRREENLQSVPVAVSVLTGEDLLEQGGLKIDAIGQTVPNVHFEAAGGTSGVKSPVIFIRGMGQNDFIPVEDPAVGVYLDGVYMGRNIGSVFDLVDRTNQPPPSNPIFRAVRNDD